MSGWTVGSPASPEKAGFRGRQPALPGALALAAVLLCGSAPPQSGLEGLARAVTDEELSEMRGKFVRPSGVHFFGIELLQSWQNGDGVTLHATLRFNVDFANGVNPEGVTPQLQMDWSRTCASCGDPTMDVPTLAAAQTGAVSLTRASDALLLADEFVTVRGLVQTQEIAGSDNAVQNRMRIAVAPTAPAGLSGGGGASPTGHTQQLENGDAVHFIVAQNELGLALTRGEDVVRGGVSGAASHAAQAVVLQSSLNAIRNEMNILVGMDDVPGLDRMSIGNALSAMKGKGM